MCFIKKGFQKSINRYDELPYLSYFRYTDFDNMHADAYVFKSGDNTLRGNVYYYDGYQKDVIVIFCHGIGGGHSSYMSEINYLCKSGFKVLAYDNTGCVSSDGKDILALASSLRDLDNAIISLKESLEYKNKKIYVMGHSWGGFAASNIYNFQKVNKIVAVSPFISIKQIYKDFFTDFKRLFVPRIVQLEGQAVGKKYAKSKAYDALNKEYAKGLIIHSEDDNLVFYKSTTKVLKEKVNNPNVKLLVLKDKDHHPLFTLDAVNYYNQVFGTFNKLVLEHKLETLEAKKEYFKSVDFLRIVKQDDEVWKQIIDFLKE